ncbi:MAG: heat-shock protein [Rickettsiales bacterium]|nr:heat-shock protein [Rickettsiales bacterium]
MQNTLTTIDTNKFLPFSVGFDDVLDRLFGLETSPSVYGYPPYNIFKNSENSYVIEMALAGFSKSDVSVELSDGILTIRSKKGSVNQNKDHSEDNFIHKGISSRQFERKFTLSDEIFVKSASLNNGMLKICLEKIIPEHKKAKTIKID